MEIIYPNRQKTTKTVFDVLVSRTRVLHDQTLAKIAESRKG